MEEVSDARERVLDTAEQLFHDQGYNGVTMRDIANALGIRQASLYYHVPEGKEQLFTEVISRSLTRHHLGLRRTIASSEPNFEAKLRSATKWLLSHSPLKLMSTFESDIPAISPANAHHLTALAYHSIFDPIIQIFREAQDQGEIKSLDPKLLSGAFLSIMDGISLIGHTGHSQLPMDQMGKHMIDVLLDGVRNRTA